MPFLNWRMDPEQALFSQLSNAAPSSRRTMVGESSRQEGTLVLRHAHPTNPNRWIRAEPEMRECELLAASPRFRTSFETESPTLVLEDLFRW